MEGHQNHSSHETTSDSKIDRSKMDHSKMDHSSMHHDGNPSMGMEGHDHHAMMINDFKKRFFITLILSIGWVLTGSLPVRDIFYLHCQLLFIYMADGLF